MNAIDVQSIKSLLANPCNGYHIHKVYQHINQKVHSCCKVYSVITSLHKNNNIFRYMKKDKRI